MAVFGIDLGTTFSCIARFDEKFGKVDIISNTEGDLSTPSVVYIKDNKEVIVGKAAINQLKGQNAANVVSYAKRMIADDSRWSDNGFSEYPKFKGEQLTPIHISSMILKKLTKDNVNIQELKRGEKIQCVITFPAYFSNEAKERTKQAGEMAGLDIIDMIEEPVAAALSYGLDNSCKNETVLVYDLGGGTFDVSVVQFDENGNGEVKEKKGNHVLGGFDWDKKVGFYLWEQYVKKTKYKEIKLTEDDFKNPESLDLNKQRKVNAFLQFAQNAKHNLTEMEEHEQECDTDGTLISITRQEFDELTSSLLNITMGLTDEVLKKSSQITTVLLVGGSTLMPQVKNELEARFPQFKGKIKVYEPHLAIAKGAAMLAAIRADLYSQFGAIPVIKNIASKSYGLELSHVDDNYNPIDNYIHVVIKRGTPLPAKKGEEVYTISPNTLRMPIKIYELNSDQKEARIEQGIRIGDVAYLVFDNPVPRNTLATVIFEVSEAGILTVTAKSQVDSGHVKVEIKLKGLLDAAALDKGAALLAKC